MKARVHIFFKDSVFDPQGSTVATSLQKLGFSKVKNVRMGKVIDVEIDSTFLEEAKRDVNKMCEKLLVNPVIETYRVEFLEK
jgi:phosphoribosylformylglycinamidine synthase PurS subunit